MSSIVSDTHYTLKVEKKKFAHISQVYKSNPGEPLFFTALQGVLYTTELHSEYFGTHIGVNHQHIGGYFSFSPIPTVQWQEINTRKMRGMPYMDEVGKNQENYSTKST